MACSPVFPILKVILSNDIHAPAKQEVLDYQEYILQLSDQIFKL